MSAMPPSATGIAVAPSAAVASPHHNPVVGPRDGCTVAALSSDGQGEVRIPSISTIRTGVLVPVAGFAVVAGPVQIISIFAERVVFGVGLADRG